MSNPRIRFMNPTSALVLVKAMEKYAKEYENCRHRTSKTIEVRDSETAKGTILEGTIQSVCTDWCGKILHKL